MALIKCAECQREVSTRAAACPHCGCPVPAEVEATTPQQSPPIPPAWQQPQQPESAPPQVPFQTATTSPLKVLAYVGLGILVLLGFAITCSKPSSTARGGTPSDASSDATAAEAAAKAAEAAANAAEAAAVAQPTNEPPKPEVGAQWSYSSEEEGMSGKSVHTAAVTSTNTINLDFPYAGAQNARLAIRRHPRWGNDVILSIEKGQLLCHSYGDCAIGVRFDDGKVLRFDGNPPSDNSSEYAFIPAYSTFMKQLPKAKMVKIEVQIYQAGSQVFEFDVSGFDATKLK